MSKIDIKRDAENKSLLEIVVIDSASPEDHLSFVNIFNKQYNRKIKSTYFFWQFFESIAASRLLVVRRNDKVIGFMGIQIRQLNNFEKCGIIVDMLIEEPYRGKGIFDNILREIEKYAQRHNVIALASFTNNNGMKALTRLPNWKSISKIITLQLENDLAIDKIRVDNGQSTNQNRSSHYISFFKKNAEYRQWRYDKNPNYSYSKVSINQDFFAITKIFSDPITGQHFGDIVDFEGDINDLESLKKLFIKAIEQLKEQGAETITIWALPHIPFKTIITELGFRDTQQERYFCLKVLNKNHEYLYDFSRWHLVQADAEIY